MLGHSSPSRKNKRKALRKVFTVDPILRMGKLTILLFVSIITLFTSCRKNEGLWDVNVASPLAYGSLGINDIIDKKYTEFGADSSIILVYQDTLAQISVGDLARFPDTTLKRTFSLSEIKLANQVINHRVSLGEIAQTMGLQGALIIAANGSQQPIPPVGPITSGQTPINVSQFFQSANIQSGQLTIYVKNGLPVEITQATLVLTDGVSGSQIFSKTLTNIPPNSIKYDSIDLSGKTLGSLLNAGLANFYLAGTNGTQVLIDTSNAIELKLGVKDLKVNEATAVFPAQNVIDLKSDMVLDVAPSQLTYARLREGELEVKLVSTIQDTIYFTYVMPKLKRNGVPIVLSRKLPPATANNPVELSEILNLKGFEADLTGLTNNLYNSLSSYAIARIDSNGKLVTISLTDSVYLYYSFKNLYTDYVKGYFGQIAFDASESTSLFSNPLSFSDGEISFKKMQFAFSLVNEIGADGSITLQKIKGTNQSNVVDLSFAQLNTPIALPRAKEFPSESGSVSFILNETNSNVTSFIGNNPNELQTSIIGELNPNGNTSNFNDFTYGNSTVLAKLDASIPLEVNLNNIILLDTIPIDLSSLEEVKAGNLTLTYENGFPLSAKLGLTILNYDNSRGIDLPIAPNTIQAGLINSQEIVYETAKGKLNVPLSEQDLSALKASKYIILSATLNTASVLGSTTKAYPKIYDHYKLDIKLFSNATVEVK